MTKPRDPEALLSAYLVDGMEHLPDRVADAVLDEIHRTRQRAVFGPWRTRSMFKPSLAAAAVVAVLVSGALLMSRPSQPVIGGPSPALGVSPSPSQRAPTPTAEVLSVDLTWTEVDIDRGAIPPFDSRSPGPWKVAWLVDRFVQIDSSGAVLTSTDGTSWEVLQPGDPDPGYAELLKRRASLVTWEDQIVGWSNPQDEGDITNKPPITARDVLRIVQPPAQPTVTTPFEGRIQFIGIGPAGIVAQTIFEPDERTVLYPGWFSPDGIEWTAIPAVGAPSSERGAWFPGGFQDVVGVSDGFIARGGAEGDDTCRSEDGCSSMWHSSDGLAWRNLGHLGTGPEASSGRLVPWKGGALLADGVGRLGLWTSQGYSELPMEETDGLLATGPLGLVSIRPDSMEVLVTRDGVDWKLQPMPAAMVTVSDWWLAPTIAVGDRSVLYQTWVGSYEEGYVASLWVGSVVP